MRVAAWSAAGFLVLATMVWSSGEDMFFGSLFLLVLGGWGLLGLVGVAWFIRSAWAHAEGWLREWALVWLGCATAFLGSVAVAVTGAPESARIELSRSALVDAGERVLAGEHPGRAGLYGLSSTEIRNGCAMLGTGAAISSSGFAYCPAGSPSGFRDLGGGLYKNDADD